jgi:hypothetical protein
MTGRAAIPGRGDTDGSAAPAAAGEKGATMRAAAKWVEDLWRAASALRQAAVPYAETDERVRVALERLAAVLDGDGRK